MDEQKTLHIAEIPYDSGAIRFRYSRYMSEDGERWVRHGLFTAYHEDGEVASEVTYEHGVEQGRCRDFHANGQLATQGDYVNGKENGIWRYWDSDGNEESRVEYRDGEEIC